MMDLICTLGVLLYLAVRKTIELLVIAGFLSGGYVLAVKGLAYYRAKKGQAKC